MHICTVATLCFPEKTVPRNYYYCVQDDNSLCLCFKNMYRTLFVAIFTSTFIFSMSKSSHTYRNINISNQIMRSFLVVRYVYVEPGNEKIDIYCSVRMKFHVDLVQCLPHYKGCYTLLLALSYIGFAVVVD